MNQPPNRQQPYTTSSFIEALQRQEPRAFERLVNEYKDQMVNTCYGFLQNTEDAEDVAQEVFMEVFKSIHKFRAEAKLSTWMYRIAVNKSLNLIKKKKRKQWIGSLQNFFGGEEVAKQVPDNQQVSPQQQIEQAERRKVLQQAIEQLPNSQKIAFTLHKYEDLSYKEIAEVMDTSLSAVESLLHRAKKNLQKKLHHYYHSNR